MATPKKVTALEAEVKNLDITFEFEGETYTVPTPRRWPLSVLRAQENGKALGAVERLLGKAQYDKFDPKGDRTMEDLDFLMEALMAAAELDPKE